jgi:hypothetical protein
MRGLVPIGRTVCRSDALQPSFPLVALSAGATRFSRRFRSRNLKEKFKKKFKGHPRKFLKMLDRWPHGEQKGT